MTQFALFPTPIGDCGIAWTGDNVTATHLPDRTPAATEAGLAARTGSAKGDPPGYVRDAVQSITALLEGDQTDLTFIACDFSQLDPFAANVYATTRAIPAGETVSYGEIASRLGDKQLARRVGQMLGRNPFPIIVPCHRVMGADGRLIGFSAPGGTETKLKLLEIEGAMTGASNGLFGHLPLAMKPGN
ncbi:MAG: methylated-DNA--[protein]-cysteine S-methyltransferase [Henriciella sp.]|nr:methylated-DNA--[protein]-cysteine S-methyltransferase [Henriciella sp.]